MRSASANLSEERKGEFPKEKAKRGSNKGKEENQSSLLRHFFRGGEKKGRGTGPSYDRNKQRGEKTSIKERKEKDQRKKEKEGLSLVINMKEKKKGKPTILSSAARRKKKINRKKKGA